MYSQSTLFGGTLYIHIYTLYVFSNSLSALCFILYDLFSARRFVATGTMIVKFQRVDKQGIR